MIRKEEIKTSCYSLFNNNKNDLTIRMNDKEKKIYSEPHLTRRNRSLEI